MKSWFDDLLMLFAGFYRMLFVLVLVLAYAGPDPFWMDFDTHM